MAAEPPCAPYWTSHAPPARRSSEAAAEAAGNEAAASQNARSHRPRPSQAEWKVAMEGPIHASHEKVGLHGSPAEQAAHLAPCEVGGATGRHRAAVHHRGQGKVPREELGELVSSRDVADGGEKESWTEHSDLVDVPRDDLRAPSKCRVGCEDDKSVSQETEGARGRVCTRSERVQEEDGHANPEDPATSEAFHRILVLDQNVSLWIVDSPASFSNSGTTFPLFESLGNR
eukprot:CAMPEP_0172620104 /NCGR_PEP_ID=MMETSP1068-20121228/100217_1 /TAXON_ID=35684 /ORGANISM="Pseudopedinella elastica, Strain CCMP716" /LENGTH=229 /DNA_ID=CAMNT_0013427207 /DNA_START=29 /DNA_END=717 /DNA_ORIENTATION=-